MNTERKTHTDAAHTASQVQDEMYHVRNLGIICSELSYHGKISCQDSYFYKEGVELLLRIGIIQGMGDLHLTSFGAHTLREMGYIVHSTPREPFSER